MKFLSVTLVSEVLLRTELGMICRLPARSTTAVERHVTSRTVPVTLPTVTWSPGWITRNSNSEKPPIRLEIVSCRPREIATETTPRAVTKAVGCTPNTGCSTEISARDQIRARSTLIKIEADGRSDAANALRAMRTRMRCTTSATATATARYTIFPTSSVIAASDTPCPSCHIIRDAADML